MDRTQPYFESTLSQIKEGSLDDRIASIGMFIHLYSPTIPEREARNLLSEVFDFFDYMEYQAAQKALSLAFYSGLLLITDRGEDSWLDDSSPQALEYLLNPNRQSLDDIYVMAGKMRERLGIVIS